MRRIGVFACLLVGSLAGAAAAQDYRVEKLDQKPPAELAPDIAARLHETGVKVVRGQSRTLCEIWLAKEWPVGDAQTSDTVLFPFTPGQLMGAIRFPRKTTDFREQGIEPGVYTLRYGQQPVDGAHVGTSPTRDFWLLLPADQDKSPDVIADYKTLTKASAASAGTNHPAILLLQTTSETESPAMRHNEEKDWWLVRLTGKVKAGGQTKDQPLEVVVVGHFVE